MEVKSTQVNIKIIMEVKVKYNSNWNTKVVIYINDYYQYVFT